MSSEQRHLNPPPAHVAVIMDGNRRWAERQGVHPTSAYIQGGQMCLSMIGNCVDLGIKYVTFFIFSLENWKRPEAETDIIMSSILDTFERASKQDDLVNKISLSHIGELEQLSEKLREKIALSTARTAQHTGLRVYLALNYSGRSEILQATRKIAKAVQQDNVPIDSIDEKYFESFLYTHGTPDPDLLIRTGGEQRLSNFLLWQSHYTELYMTKVLWPDFSKSEFRKAIHAYQNRERRFGHVR